MIHVEAVAFVDEAGASLDSAGCVPASPPLNLGRLSLVIASILSACVIFEHASDLTLFPSNVDASSANAVAWLLRA